LINNLHSVNHNTTSPLQITNSAAKLYLTPFLEDTRSSSIAYFIAIKDDPQKPTSSNDQSEEIDQAEASNTYSYKIE
jgi:hypothetical protein